jgi:putative transposase
VLRYVERNPLRANLVARAEDWPWSSLAWRVSGVRPDMLAQWPVACPRDWLAWVQRAQLKREEEALRRATDQGQPFGSRGLGGSRCQAAWPGIKPPPVWESAQIEK